MRGDLLWASIPEMAASTATRFGDAEAVVDGDRRVTLRRARRRLPSGDRLRWLPSGIEPGERDRDLGAESLRVVGGRARHARRRCSTGAGEHALQGQRGAVHPRAQRRTSGLHRGRVPRHGLRRDAGAISDLASRTSTSSSASTTYRTSTTRSTRSCGSGSPATTPPSMRASARCKRTTSATCCSRRERPARPRAC